MKKQRVTQMVECGTFNSDAEGSSPSPLANFEIRMPTPEEHRKASLAWLSRVQPTLIDQWPQELAALSMKTEMVAFPPELIDEFYGLHDRESPGPIMDDIARELDARMRWDRKFIRLNSRSPKDSPYPFEAPITCSGKEALLMLAGSMRVIDDLTEFKWVPEQPAYICLREFIPGLSPGREFRCFVKDGELIAVTHYDYVNPIKGPEDGGKELRKQIDKWFAEALLPVLHLKSVVFDIWRKHDGSFLLIEINPYGLSDPCHFGSYAAVESATGYIQFQPVEVSP